MMSRNEFTGGIPATSRTECLEVITIPGTSVHRTLFGSLTHRIASRRGFGHPFLLCNLRLEAELLLVSFTFHLPSATV